MSDFRCPNYWWDGNQWRCKNLPNDYLSLHDFDTYCTNKNRCLECQYMDSDVREKVAAWKKETEERREERLEDLEDERKKEYEESRDEDIPDPDPTPTPPPDSGSNDGCLSALFSTVAVVIGAVIKLLLPILKIFFLGIWLPSCVEITWVFYILGILAACAGSAMLDAVAVILIAMALYTILQVTFIPYWGILIWQKIKKQMTWKEVCVFYGKWFLKGPFAYVDLSKALNKNNSVPKIAELLNKIIDWFRKLFKK